MREIVGVQRVWVFVFGVKGKKWKKKRKMRKEPSSITVKRGQQSARFES